MQTNFSSERVDSSLTTQRPRPRIESLTDLVFGLALSIGAIILISKQPANPVDLYRAIAGFGFSFLLSAIPQVWVLNVRYTIWASTFFVYRGGSLVRGLRKLRKRRHSR